MLVGNALLVGRRWAMAEANTDRPAGKIYNQLFGQWIEPNGFAELDKSDRAKLLKIVEHKSEIEAWRAIPRSISNRHRKLCFERCCRGLRFAHECAPIAGVSYVGFVDPSGGSADAMTLAIAHREGERGLLDAIREQRPPFSPDDVVREFAALLKSYRVHRVRGDRYAGEWPAERFAAHGIKYEPSDKTKNEIYGEVLPLLNSGRVELLDHSPLLSQLLGLERRTARGGRDSIDHAPGAHDDVANAAAGAVVFTVGQLSNAERWARMGRNLQALLATAPTNALPMSAIAYAQERARRGLPF